MSRKYREYYSIKNAVCSSYFTNFYSNDEFENLTDEEYENICEKVEKRFYIYCMYGGSSNISTGSYNSDKNYNNSTKKADEKALNKFTNKKVISNTFGESII
ncbi:hypothetical protein PIROE2DRAFT_18578 [Piromyces sp. E2]|nr:hypothetical protein PIROE2DRAFT_18578 [Piromyces sp. E2]|eukprot:OUM56695.1 hypothetical protein PIROE2DRAFT_18578 [Piromyces sp. E2]